MVRYIHKNPLGAGGVSDTKSELEPLDHLYAGWSEMVGGLHSMAAHLNGQIIDAVGDLVDAVMGDVASHGNDGNDCADHSHRHTHKLGENATA